LRDLFNGDHVFEGNFVVVLHLSPLPSGGCA
jgi:hypothetical protein